MGLGRGWRVDECVQREAQVSGPGIEQSALHQCSAGPCEGGGVGGAAVQSLQQSRVGEDTGIGVPEGGGSAHLGEVAQPWGGEHIHRCGGGDVLMSSRFDSYTISFFGGRPTAACRVYCFHG